MGNRSDFTVPGGGDFEEMYVGGIRIDTTGASENYHLVYDASTNSFKPTPADIGELINDVTDEPMGHEDRTASTISFDDSTRIFSISPVSSNYYVWCAGYRFEKTSTETVTIPNSAGLYYIYFDTNGDLQYRTSYFVWNEDCPTAYVYWNGSDGFLFDERHGVTLDWQTHEYLHRTRGAVIANGLLVSEYNSSNESIEVEDGTFFDEDLQVDINHSTSPSANTWEQQLQGPARIPVMYRSGTTWVKDTATDYPFKLGTTYPVYNSNSAGNWSTTEFSQNDHGIMWIVATNMLESPVLSIMGQQLYNNVDDAREQTWEGMDFTGLPIVEIRVLAKIIFLTNDTSANMNIEIIEISDYRRAMGDATSSASAVVSHSSLTDLSADDHPHYLLIDGSRSMTGALQLPAGPDVTGSGGGSLRLGNYGTQESLAIDANEIQRFDTSGNPANLNLNIVGAGITVGTTTSPGTSNFNGSVNVTGDLDVGGTGGFVGEITISESSPQIHFEDTDHDDFWIHINSNNFYVLADRDEDGSWETPHPLQLEADTDTAYTFGNRILTVADEGSGNGLDADTVDGIQAGSFLRSDAPDTASSAITFSGGLTLDSNLTWNNGKNIVLGGECSFDLSSGDTWGTWDGAYAIKHAYGAQVEIGASGTRGLKVHGQLDTTGNINVDKAQAWLTVGSLTTGGNYTDQSAGVSVGESADGPGAAGTAAIHMTYSGDGYGYIGMGSLNNNGYPSNRALRFYYTSGDVYAYNSIGVGGSVVLDGQPLTTYGSGVTTTPPNRIEGGMGSNDHWRIYGEGGSNDGRMVLHVGDDQTEYFVFRHKKTYSPYTVTEHTLTTNRLTVNDEIYATSTISSGGGIVIGGTYSKTAFNNTYASKHGIQLEVDTYWGGYHDNHTGFLIWCGQMNSGSWGTSELGFRGSNNWGSYYTSNPVRMKGTRAYINLGIETTLGPLYADGGGRVGYNNSRRDIKNIIGYVSPEDGLNRILALKPVDFTYKKESREILDDVSLIDFDVFRGFIAEEVAEVDRVMAQYGWLQENPDHPEGPTIPLTEELHRTDKTLDEAQVVSYDQRAILADLTSSVQALHGMVQQINSRLDALEGQNGAT